MRCRESKETLSRGSSILPGSASTTEVVALKHLWPKTEPSEQRGRQRDNDDNAKSNLLLPHRMSCVIFSISLTRIRDCSITMHWAAASTTVSQILVNLLQESASTIVGSTYHCENRLGVSLVTCREPVHDAISDEWTLKTRFEHSPAPFARRHRSFLEFVRPSPSAHYRRSFIESHMKPNPVRLVSEEMKLLGL